MKKINNQSTLLTTSTKMLSNIVCEGGHNLHQNVAKFCA